MGLLLPIFLVGFLPMSLSVGAEEMFCVEPTVSTTKCPCSDSRCHLLEDYVNNFTSNSRFFFMEGEHHLFTSVKISNVANLSLVGAGPRVKILCKSVSAGFLVEQFTFLKLSDLAISNCNGATVTLQSGSEVSLGQIAISNSFGHDAAGIEAFDILGSFSITNSVFTSGSKIVAQYYSNCSTPSIFDFSDNLIAKLEVRVYCSNVQIRLTDSTFRNEDTGVDGLKMSLLSLFDNSILIDNSTFSRAGIYITLCVEGCSAGCKDNNFMKLSGINSTSPVYFLFGGGFPVGCNITIKDSLFSDSPPSHYTPTVIFTSDVSKTTNDTIAQAILSNVTFTNITEHPVSYLIKAAIKFVNCTFENNKESAIHASGSKLIFEGYNMFKKNSGLVGGGIQLLDSSYLYLHPNTHILFEKNHVDFVGGAIYTDYGDTDDCIFRADLQSYKSIDVNFTENVAELSGNSLYGGGLETCGVPFYYIFNVSNTETDPSAVASDPNAICLCTDGKRKPNCSPFSRSYSTEAFPGQEFPIHLAVVGASFNGVVPGAIRAFLDPSNGTLGSSQYSQVSDKPTCMTFFYSVKSHSVDQEVVFLLTAEHDFLKSLTTLDIKGLHQIVITVNLNKCPIGFSLSSNGTCGCDPVLSGVDCEINDQTFLRQKKKFLDRLH